jgi:hypothetical protein
MYWSDSDNVDKLPRCTVYMKSALNPKSLKSHNKKVYEAFIKACGGARKQAEHALQWGNSPSVGIASGLIRIAGKTICGFNPPTFFNQNSKTVSISDVRTWPLENCSADVDLVKNKRRFESTLLHEIIHLVRMVANKSDVDFDFPDTEEPGDQFEIWAYGKRLCDQDEIEDAFLSVRK